MSKAFQPMIINRHTGLKKKKKKSYKKMSNTNSHSREHIPLAHHPRHPINTHTHPHPYCSTNLHTHLHHYYHQPDTHTHPWIYTHHSNLIRQLLQRMVKTVQMTDHALLRSCTAVGTKEFPLLLVSCARDLNQHPCGNHSNSPCRACSGSFKIDTTLCKICLATELG